MTDLWEKLAADGRPVCLYGTGNGADKIMDELQRRGIPVSAVFASDSFVRSRMFRGFEVLSYSRCKERYPDMTVLMCFGSSRPEVLENAERIAAEYPFYAPDVPVYGDTLFDRRFYEEHRQETEEVRRHLADGLSVECFDAHIQYKLSGDVSFLRSCETPREQIENEFFSVGNGTFVDLGAYTGDTVSSFVRVNGTYRQIIAVEPDRRNFRKLRENTSSLTDVICLNAAAGEADGEILFDASKGRGAHAGEGGETLPCRCVDSILADCPDPGELLIKIDAEGAELDVINGAQRTIRKYRPVVAAACYHRSEDLFTIPLRMLKLCPDYRIYMRHSPHIPAWDTEYYFR